jgi:hypothetical protein
MSDQRTVRVATCYDQAESALIRAVLSAHGIVAIIPGDGVPHMGLGGVAFHTAVFVREDQADQATALITEMREGRSDEDAGEDDAADDADNADDADDADEQSLATSDVAVVVKRRARMVVTLMLALMLTFGTGHMSTGAWKRGIALGAVEAVGIQHLAAGHRWGIVLVLGAVLVDLVGALARVRKLGAPSTLPTARVRR